MDARMHKPSMTRDWKEVYKAALLEDDSAKIPQRIAEAEKALAARASELFGVADDQVREQQAMENARYFLRMLENTAATLNPEPQYLLVPAGRQDLHTTRSTPSF